MVRKGGANDFARNLRRGGRRGDNQRTHFSLQGLAGGDNQRTSSMARDGARGDNQRTSSMVEG